MSQAGSCSTYRSWQPGISLKGVYLLASSCRFGADSQAVGVTASIYSPDILGWQHTSNYIAHLLANSCHFAADFWVVGIAACICSPELLLGADKGRPPQPLENRVSRNLAALQSTGKLKGTGKWQLHQSTALQLELLQQVVPCTVKLRDCMPA